MYFLFPYLNFNIYSEFNTKIVGFNMQKFSLYYFNINRKAIRIFNKIFALKFNNK